MTPFSDRHYISVVLCFLSLSIIQTLTHTRPRIIPYKQIPAATNAEKHLCWYPAVADLDVSSHTRSFTISFKNIINIYIIITSRAFSFPFSFLDICLLFLFFCFGWAWLAKRIDDVMNNHFHSVVCAVITGSCDNFAVRHPSLSPPKKKQNKKTKTKNKIDRYSRTKKSGI